MGRSGYRKQDISSGWPERSFNWLNFLGETCRATPTIMPILCLEKVKRSFEIKGLTLQARYLPQGVPDDLP